VGSALVLRDRWLGRIKPARGLEGSERVWIVSGQGRLDAVWVRAAEAKKMRAAVLICHGIGEVVEHWACAQELLAQSGVSSLVFNYSGCGRSDGRLSAEGCERDAEAAFWWLRNRLPEAEVTLLGFSLGSGVAAAVAARIPVSGMVLCEAYTSFRNAVGSVGVPGWACGAVPDVWQSEQTLRTCNVPVLVVHGEQDGLFPVSMGERLAQAAGDRVELLVVPGMGHSDLHAKVRPGDWRAILEWIDPPSDRRGKSEIKA